MFKRKRFIRFVSKGLKRDTEQLISDSTFLWETWRIFVCMILGISPASGRRGNAQKNTYNIQNTAKVWNPEGMKKFPIKYATHMAYLHRGLVFLGAFRTSAAVLIMPGTTMDFSVYRRSSTCYILVSLTQNILFYTRSSSLQPCVRHCTALLFVSQSPNYNR